MTKDNEKNKEATGFAPHNPSDGKEKGEWRSSYSNVEAKKHIRTETIYISGLFFLAPLLSFLIYNESINKILFLEQHQFDFMKPYLYAGIGGLFGGTLFSTKWLYHSVAKNIWHLDRRLWRFLTPWLSSGLALGLYIIMKSGIFTPFDSVALTRSDTAFSLGFLIGYFSDSATAKLSEIAQTLFGVSKKS